MTSVAVNPTEAATHNVAQAAERVLVGASAKPSGCVVYRVRSLRCVPPSDREQALQRFSAWLGEALSLPCARLEVTWLFGFSREQEGELFLSLQTDDVAEAERTLRYAERYVDTFRLDDQASQRDFEARLPRGHQLSGVLVEVAKESLLVPGRAPSLQQLPEMAERLALLRQPLALRLSLERPSREESETSVLGLEVAAALERMSCPESGLVLGPQERDGGRALLRFGLALLSNEPLSRRHAMMVVKGLTASGERAWVELPSADERVPQSVLPMQLRGVLHETNAACVLQLPLTDRPLPALPMLDDLPSAQLPAGLPMVGIELGESAETEPRSIRLAPGELARHVYLVGKTGTGKSTVLKSMIASAVLANESAVFVVDPHGDLVQDLLRWMPEEHAERCVYIDFSETSAFPGLNLLDTQGCEHGRELAIADLDSFFLALYGPEVWGPRIQDVFRNLALLLSLDPSGPNTLVDLLWAVELNNPQVLKRCQTAAEQPSCPPTAALFLEQIRRRQTGDGSLQEMVSYFRAKFSPLVDNLYLRNILGQARTTLDFAELTAERRICLFNLDKGQLSARHAHFVGRILLSRIVRTTLSSSRTPQALRPPAALFLDEFQNLISGSVEELLSEARKFRWSVVLANQYLAQLRQRGVEVRSEQQGMLDAILGNVGTQIAFRVTGGDSERLAADLGIRPSMLRSLPNHHAVVRIARDGMNQPAFLMRTRQLEPAASDRSDEIRQRSLARYCTPRPAVEDSIRRRLHGALGIAQVPSNSIDSILESL